jgi:hypothetical protein
LTNGQTANVTLSYTAPATGAVAVSTTISTTTSQGTNALPDHANGSTNIIDAVNDGPVTLPYNGGGNVTLLTNDTLGGGAVTIGGNISAPTITNNGGLTGATINGSGQLVVPTHTTPGTYTVTYQICSLNPTSACDTATVSVNIQTTPVANTDSGTTLVNQVLNSNTPGSGQSVNNASILTNDTGNGITLTSVTGTGIPCSSFPCTITTSHGSAVVQSGGTYVYTPTSGYSGSDNFSYVITDSIGQTANASVNLTVTPVADVTTTVSAPASANAGSTVNVPITFSNNGPSTAAGVTYSATLPTGLSGVGKVAE